jgi:O-antigen/teichoic acid export membrane protein
VLLRTGVRDFRWSSPRAALGAWRETLRFGGPLQLGNVLAVTHQQLDKVLLARFVAFPVIAAYELGLRITTAATTVPQLLLLPVTPAAAELQAAGAPAARLYELHVRASRYVLVASAVVVSGLLASAPRLLAAWLGHPDADAALALRGLALAAYAGLGCGAAPAIARALARTDLEAEFSAVALAVHLALGLWLVRTHGLAGVLLALAVGNLVGAGWFLSRLAVTAGWPRGRTIFEPIGVPLLSLLAGFSVARLVGDALPVAAGAAAWPAALLVGAVAAAITGALALVTRYLSWDEARALLRLRRA